MTTSRPNTIDFASALELLRKGKICAFPTDTVFGIGARADDPDAVEALFTIKNRSPLHPIVVLCADVNMAKGLVEFSSLAIKLISFWPGALTLVLPSKANPAVSDQVNAGSDFLGVRIPASKSLQELIEQLGYPLATTSANLSGQKIAVTTSEIVEVFSNKLPVFAGDRQGGNIESTILQVQGNSIKLLRSGAISLAEIENKLGFSIEPPLRY